MTVYINTMINRHNIRCEEVHCTKAKIYMCKGFLTHFFSEVIAINFKTVVAVAWYMPNGWRLKNFNPLNVTKKDNFNLVTFCGECNG